MDVVFPDIPVYQGWGAPLRIESDLQDLEVIQGSVPRELAGTLYRCGPDRQYPPLFKDDVFIDGEGMVVMFRFEDGHVDFKSRWVRNERFLAQAKARRSLFGRYRNRYTNDPSVEGVDTGTATTTPVWHGGKLLVLKDTAMPIELDPDTLETRAKWDYDGAVKAVSMTAHPKLDEITGELLTFSYQARGDATTDVVYYVIGKDGKVAHEVWFNMPWPACVHDFAVSESHVVFPFFPLITDLEVLKKGGPFYQWHPEEQCHFAVLPRYGKAEDIRWFRGPAASAGHMMNAVTEGSKVHLDLCLYDGNCFPFFPTPDGKETQPVPPFLTRLTFDLASNSDAYTQTRLCPVPCEMPRTDDRWQGRPYRHGYMMSFTNRAEGNSLGHIDFQTGKFETLSFGKGTAIQEPCFVPRRPDAPEGDGWIVAIVNCLEENHSNLAVVDATNITAGPVALLKLPVRVRMTFHGMWVPAEALRTGQYDMKLGPAQAA
jgi:carotenoid cleavage dioxygenase